MADSALRDEVRSTVAALEAQCHELGPVIDRCDWKAFQQLLSDMARMRHALANAWHAVGDERTPELEEEIYTRVKRILEYRNFQLGRLEQFHDQTRSRLQLISRWRAYARSIAGKKQTSSALFSDIR